MIVHELTFFGRPYTFKKKVEQKNGDGSVTLVDRESVGRPLRVRGGGASRLIILLQPKVQ